MPKKAPTKSKTKPAAKATPKKLTAVKASKPVKKAAPVKTAPKKAAKPVKAAKASPKKGRGRVTSASGPLSTAVVKILKGRKRPLNCREITETLLKNGYQFTHPEPKRIVSIRIYKLKGVKQTGPGLFTAE